MNHSPDTTVDLSIIIVSWNTRALLAQCLRSIEATARTTPRPDACPELRLRIQTFVVDNGSSDGSAAMVRRRFPWVSLMVNRQNVGFARANNQAIRRGEAPYVLLLNSDAELQLCALETLIHFMEAHPRAAASGPQLLNGDGTLQPSCHPMLTPWREFWRLTFLERLKRLATYDMARWDRHSPRQVEVIKGACLMLRRQALDQVGLLDQRYFMYSEEMDLCYRLLHAGWRLYWVPEAHVVHYGEGSSRQVAEDMYLQLYRSKIQFYRKIGGDGRAATFKRLLALAYGPRWAVAAAASLVARRWSRRARTFRRLLVELPMM